MQLDRLAEHVRRTGRYLIDHADELVSTSALATTFKMRIQIVESAFEEPVRIEVLPVYEREVDAPGSPDARRE